MEIKTAKSAGFCFGVRRAVDTVYRQAAEKSQPVYTYGPIIHNEAVVKDLKRRVSGSLRQRNSLRTARAELLSSVPTAFPERSMISLRKMASIT